MTSPPTTDRSDPLSLVGTIFEKKYRVDRVVAEGGFGVVYAGVHLTMNVPVALKVLRPSLRSDREDWTDVILQFREEASVLSRLRRASVVAVLDSGVAPLGDDPAGLPWMALEWLDGETLKVDLERRRGSGGRTPVECMNLLRPVFEAIAEAHDLGIAHRDLKPSNIMLVPTKNGVSPCVLDFGIAKLTAPAETTASSTGDTATDSSLRAFTAASAAPEQLSGARTGPWTDVYALALLMTEVLTDEPPIAAVESNERHRIAFATERPTPARVGVDVGAWEPVLSRALAVRPGDRPRDARALMDELDRALANGDAVTARTAGQAPLERPRKPRPRALFAALALALALFAGLGAWAWQGRREPPAIAVAGRPLVVVAELRASDADRRVAATVAELLSDQLRVGDAMRVPSPDARAAMLEASGLAKAAPRVTGDVLGRLRAAAGADIVVGGEVMVERGSLRADLVLYDAAKGKNLYELSLTAPSADVNAFVREAAARVRRALGRPGLSAEDETALRSSLPEDPEASLAFVDGLAARRLFRFRDAVARFEDANRRAPHFAPALSALAQAHLMLGEQTLAREAADRAVQLAPGLPRADELIVYAIAAEARHDWDGAVESYRALASFYPDRVDHVTSLGRALVGAGKPGEAVTLLEAAKKRPQSDWDLVRIELMLSHAYSRKSEDAASIAAAREAERLGMRIGARVPVADAVLDQAHAQHRAGNFDEALALFARARAVYVEVGEGDNILHCDAATAEIARARGDFDTAISVGERLVAAYRATGNLYRTARATVSLGIAHATAGHLRKARELCDEGGHLYIEAHDREGEAFRWMNLAQFDLMLGQLDGVRDGATRARALHATLGQRAGVAEADQILGRLLWAEGHLAEADAQLETAFIESKGAGEAALVADLALDRARLAFERASTTEQARFDEAAAVIPAASEERITALFEVLGARRALAAGDLAEAERRVHAAEAHADKSHAPDAQLLARAARLDLLRASSEASHGDAGVDDVRAAASAEISTRLASLEAVPPAIDALLSLARSARGDDAVAFAERARAMAASHGLVVAEAVALRAIGRARGGAKGAAEVVAADRDLAKLGAKGAAR